MPFDPRDVLRECARGVRLPEGLRPARDSTGFWLLVGLLVVVAWSVWLLHPLGTGYRHLVADMDAFFHSWNLWWVYRALAVEHTSPYFTSYGGFPHGTPLIYHSSILPMGAASIPLFLLGLQAGQVFLVWHYVFAAAGYLGMFALLHRLRAPPPGCAAAGLFYVLIPFFRNNLARPDTVCYVLLPLVLLAVVRMRRGGFTRVLTAGGAAGAMLLMSPYYGLGLGVLWLLGFFVCARLEIPYRRYAAVGPLMLLISSFEWIPQALGTPPAIPYQGPVPFQMSSFLYPSADLLWVRLLEGWVDLPTSITGFFHQSLYLGAIPLALVLVTAIDRWSPLTRWSLLAGLVFLLIGGANYVVLGRGSSPDSPWTVFSLAVELYEPLKAFRGPRRFVVFTVFFASVGLGFFRGWTTRWSEVLFVLVVVELFSLPLQHVQSLPPADMLRTVRREVKAPALVSIPIRSSGSAVDYGQTIHGKKLPLAPVTHPPVSLRRFLESNEILRALYHRELAPVNAAGAWEELEDMGYGGVILHHDPFTREQDYWVRLQDPAWPRVRGSWRKELRRRFGPPAISNDFFELYRFDPSASPEDRSDAPSQ